MAEENVGAEVVQNDGTATEAGTTATATFDRAALEEKASQGLAALFGDEPDDETPADETNKSSDEETPAEDTDKEDGAEDEDNKDEPDNTEVEKEPAKEEKAAATPVSGVPTLPDAYRRSLKAYGWEDEDIDANLKALGGNFVVTAQKIHGNRNKEIAEWAESGRRAREATKASAEKPASFEMIKPIDASALKEHYGDDKLIDSLLTPVNAAIAQINAMVPAIQRTQQSSETAKLETLGRQIESFFTGDRVKPYAEVYGDATKTLTDAHIQERNKVLETADALMCGAQIQGRAMSLDDALTLALDSVSGNFRAKAARKEIVNSLQKREKGITFKPGNKGRQAASAGAPPKTRSDLEKKVVSGLKKVFG